MNKKIISTIFTIIMITTCKSFLLKASSQNDKQLMKKPVDYLNYDMHKSVQKDDPVSATRAKQIEWCALNYPEFYKFFIITGKGETGFASFLSDTYPADISDNNKRYCDPSSTAIINVNDHIKKSLIDELQKYNPDTIHNLKTEYIDSIEKFSPIIFIGTIQQSKNLAVQYALEHKNSFALPLIKDAIREWIINTPDKKREKRSLLHNALRDCNEKFAKLLITAGADPNLPDKNGWRPLHYAGFKNSSVEIISLLIKAGAQVNLQCKDGYSPLWMASVWSRIDRIKALLEAGADPNLQNKNGDSPLHDLAYHNRDLEKIQVLLDAKANPNLRNKHDESPLHKAIGHDREAIRQEHPGLYEILINRITEPTVQALLEADADPNLQNKNGWSPLHKAADKGNHATIRALLAAGAHLHLLDNNGKTAQEIAETQETKAIFAEFGR